MQLFVCDLCGMAELVVKIPEKIKELMSRISLKYLCDLHRGSLKFVIVQGLYIKKE